MPDTGREEPPLVVDWGRTRYEDALARQIEMVAVARGRGTRDTLVLTEHEAVFTTGLRPGARNHLVWDSDRRRELGIGLVESNRGGDITYHGPGQLVAYPIVSLVRHQDLHAYLRFLEDVVIATLGDFGLSTGRREGKTGIWVENRKIAAIGVAVRRWIAYHGLALNIQPDLAHFQGIIPCGIVPEEGTVTSMARELAQAPAIPSVKAALATRFLLGWPEFISSGLKLNRWLPVTQHSETQTPSSAEATSD
jgi:lipoyl(octanoyl) transferase